MIAVQNVTKQFGSKVVLQDLSLTVATGEFVALLGASGCGKSTLLNIVAGLDTAYSGSVQFSGKLGYVFQEARLLPWLTVAQNLTFVQPETSADSISTVLQQVGLNGCQDHYPHQLSLGMQQRASVARALVINPSILLMDEPFGALDELTAQKLRTELLSLFAKEQYTVLFVTHNPLEAAYLADRICVLGSGGTFVGEMPISQPRTRDMEDTTLWQLSREAVRLLS